MRGEYLTRKYRDCDADVSARDYGIPEGRCVSKEMIEELKQDWEQGIINELIYADKHP